MVNIKNYFKGKPPPDFKTPKGMAGYDNPRENIDPHIKTKVVSSQEYEGKISPIIVIAASNAPADKKRKANYICSGSNDQEVINRAIATLPIQYAGGGIIQFTEGDFYINGVINLSDYPKIMLLGSGMHSTRLLSETTAGVVYTGNIIEMIAKDDDYFMTSINALEINGNYAASGHGIYAKNEGAGKTRDVQIREVFINSMGGDGIRCDNCGWGWKITNSISEYNGGYGIYITGASQLLINGCFIAYNDASSGIFIGSNCTELTISNNNIFKNDYTGIECRGDYCVFSGNVFNGNGQTAASYNLYLNNESSNCIVSSNVFEIGTGTITTNLYNLGNNNQIGLNNDGIINLSGALTISGGVLYLPTLKKIDGTTPADTGDTLYWGGTVSGGYIYGG